MLVCNVSLRAPRRAIAGELIETTTAADATATGNIVFATLVDDPASVADLVDAYSGEIMLEAASADAAVDAGLAYAALVVEELTADSTQAGTIGGVMAATASAMVVGSTPVFINPGSSRQGNVNGVMVNI